MIDGEAVILGVDGISDFNTQHSRKHDHEVQRVSHGRGRHSRPATASAKDKLAAPAGAAAGRDNRGAVRTRRNQP